MAKALEALISISGQIDPSLSKAIKGSTNKLGGLKKTAATIGAAAGVAMAGIVSGTVAAVKGLADLGTEFQKAQNIIRVGTGATGEDLTALMDDMKEVYKSVPTDLETAGTAIADLNTRLGLSGESVQDMATQVLQLNKMLGVDVSSTIESSSKAFEQWGISAEDMTKEMDYIYKVSQSTGMGFNEIMDSAQSSGAVLQELGFSFEDATAMIAQLDKAGINTSQVLKGMKKGLASVVKAGGSSTDAMAEYVAMIKDADTDTEALSKATEIFGTASAATMTQAIRQGALDVADFAEMMQESSETINQAAADTMTFDDKLQLLKQNAQVALEPMATKLLDIAEQALPYIQSMMESLMPIVEDFTSELVPLLESAASDILPLVGDLISEFVPVLKQIIPYVTSFLNKIFGYISKLLPKLTPIIDSLLPVIFSFLDGLMGILDSLMPVIMMILDYVSEALTMLMPLFQEIIEAILPVFASIIEAVSPFVDAILSAIMAILPVFVQLVETLLPIFMEIINALLPIFSQIIEALAPIWEKLAQFIAELLPPIIEFFGRLMEALLPVIMELLDAFMPILEPILSIIMAIMDPIMDLVLSLLPVMINLLDAVMPILKPICQILQPIAEVLGIIMGAISKVVEWVSGGLSWLINAIFGGGADMGAVDQINAYAAGGFTNGISIAGEAGTEAVISFDPAYRSQNLSYWAQAGRMLGADSSMFETIEDSGSGGSIDINLGGVTFSPNITVQGNASKDDILEALRESESEFMDYLDELITTRKAESYAAAY